MFDWSPGRQPAGEQPGNEAGVTKGYSMQLVELGEEVRRRREDRGWTVAELAALADISGATLSDIENGVTTRPHRPTLRGLARALACTIEELTGGEPKPVANPTGTEELQLLETYRALNEERRAAARQVMEGLLRLQQESRTGR